ncbi:putative bacilliredoxin, YphP/YqiW family [Terribacillus halophilus]|uniref:Putative bacilliredoxin, YphP/YqiW family n=1 Tax=Terribacillus halophilus TaxID=361279 RepID=A0A1G6JCH4_9BACI|nr:BrxA/BrxB family bacilliredoxin [Terribacillus halophilus]SDC16431.1 putative bacilliredoxin, YphP/YqiW family [Terribacillus halophilus]
MNAYEEYMRGIVQPMRDELTQAGFQELTDAEQVENYVKQTKGSTLVVVNSVCGCAAGLARPAVRESLQNAKKPEHLVTVFAGQDKEATEKMREYFTDQPPSSPSVALMHDGELVHFIPREQIEGYDVEEIVENLTTAYNNHL